MISLLLANSIKSFKGEVIQPDDLYGGKVDLMAFVGRNSKEKRGVEIAHFARGLQQRHKRVGVVGFCYGGWAAFQLGART